MNILLIGPLPPPIGGATVLFQQLATELADRPEIGFTVVRTNPESPGKWKKFVHQLLVGWRIVAKVRHVDVVAFHASISGGYKLSPFIRLLCLITGKPWIFRGFGGNYAKWYASSPVWRKYLFRASVLQASVLLLETKESVSYFSELCGNGNVQWYPNSRPKGHAKAVRPEVAASKLGRASGATRFVFVGHVQPSKGVLVLREAAQRLAADVSIDVYGPLLGGLDEASINSDCLTYRGVIDPPEVTRTLDNYDVLVLPTTDAGEGYPGVILEAYSRGLPVVTTPFRSILEIVDESSGILVDSGDAIGLAAAIEALAQDADLFVRLRDGAQKKANLFESQAWTARFLEICVGLVGPLDA